MAKIDETYHNLLLDILQHGFKYEDPNRKGTIRTQIQNYTLVHKFEDGFPAITTKKLYWKGIVGELLWFLRGDTNIKYLVDNNINIWNKDAYNYYCKSKFHKNTKKYNLKTYINCIKNNQESNLRNFISYNSNQRLDYLGKIYGAQWRNWYSFKARNYNGNNLNNHYVDQIFNLIKGLKEIPMGTKHIVTAWNPAELNNMALPPCHWSFEILVEPLHWNKRLKLFQKINDNALQQLSGHFLTLDKGPYNRIEISHEWADKYNIPKYSFILKWHQRSVDSFLGLPFNIASYALLAHIIGEMTNMIPEGIIGDLSNVHIYDNHMDAVKEQLKRDINKYDDCDLTISTKAKAELKEGLKYIDKKWIDIKDFNIYSYKSYPSIKAEMLPYNK